MQTYHKAPLPFIGQKRNFLKHFIPLLQQNIPDDGTGWTFAIIAKLIAFWWFFG